MAKKNRSSKNLKNSDRLFGAPAKDIEKDHIFLQHLEDGKWIKAAKRLKELQADSNPPKGSMGMLRDLIFLGRDMMIRGDHENAALVYAKALAIDPKNLDCFKNLAIIDQNQKKYAEALELLDQALAIRRDIPSIWTLKLGCLASLGRHDDVERLLDGNSLHNIDKITVLLDSAVRICAGNPDKAIQWIETAAHLSGSDASKWVIPAFGILKQYCHFDLLEKIDIFDAFRSISPDASVYHWLNLLPMASNVKDNRRLVEIQRAYFAFCESQIKSSEPLNKPLNRGSENKRIKIGVVGGDFCNHVVTRFLLPLLENLNKEYFQVVCFNTRERVDDDMRSRYEACCTVKEISIVDPRQAAEDLRAYSLDVCIDTSGFTAYGATHVLKWRVAPLQISMIGYPGSTFTPNIDLLVGDEIVAPTFQWMTSEKIMKVNGVATMLKPDCEMHIYPEPPQNVHGFVNFGVLVNPYKYSRECIALWGKVLKSNPGSQISIVRPECKSLSFQRNILRAFAQEGISSDQILLFNNHGRSTGYWDCYNKIDVVLDPAPMTGGVSTYDALYMGVPVVTLKGPNYHQRLSASILASIGLSECIAESDEEYVEIAGRLANSKNLLAALRSSLRSRFFESGGPCDCKGFTRRFERELVSQMLSAGLIDNSWGDALFT